MPSVLQEGCGFAERLLVGHPFNPPHILPLVKVVGGARTSEKYIELAMAFYRDAGKRPIRLRVERPGHLANRLQAALWREAVDAVASGQADVANVDSAITPALGSRWALQARGIEALALDLSDSTLQRRYGALLASLGRRSQGITAIKRATELDPLSSPAWSNLGFHLVADRQFAPPTKLFAGRSKSNRRRPIR